MNLQQIITFSTVVSEGSMTAAAEKLFLTQPAVSQQIRNLEDELGVELLVRGVRQSKTTLQGQILHDYAKRIISLTQQAEVAIQTIGAEIQGSLSIGTLNSLGLYLISPVVGLFLKHNAQLCIRLNYAKGEEIIEQFNSGDLDVAILPDVKQEFGEQLHGSERKLLRRDELWLACSGKETNLPSMIEVAQLLKKPLVSMGNTYPNFQNLILSELQKAGVEYKPAFEATNVGTLKRVVESGLGWGFLPAHSIDKQVRMGRLNTVDVKGIRYDANIYYYYRRDAKTKIVDVFYRALEQQAKGRRD